MLINQNLTLFLSLLSFAVYSAQANDFDHPSRRGHENLKRLIRKRSPFPAAGDDSNPFLQALKTTPIDPNKVDPNKVDAVNQDLNLSGSASVSASFASAASASQSASASQADVSASAASASASLSASASASISASNSVSLSASAPSAPASASRSASTPPPQQPTDNNQAPDPNPQPQQQSTVTHTSTDVSAAAATSPPPPNGPNGAAATKKTTITTVIIVVAASVGGLAILWTVFRKWKLGHSSKFDERMAPIDWQPTTNDSSDVPGLHRAASRSSSFHSSANHDAGYGAAGYRDRALEHDFTAQGSHLAPVGGYADLTRGPSPQPQMQDLGRGPLARGPSTTRHGYDNGVPLHHQAGYGQAEAYDYNGDAIRF